MGKLCYRHYSNVFVVVRTRRTGHLIAGVAAADPVAETAMLAIWRHRPCFSCSTFGLISLSLQVTAKQYHSVLILIFMILVMYV